MAPSDAASSAQPRRGSGRFTNISKYLQANQGGGQQMAGQIGSRVESDVQKAREEAESGVGAVAEGVQAGRQVFGQDGEASQIGGQLTQIGEDFNRAQEFVNQPQFGRFQTILGRGGQGDAFNQQQLEQQRLQSDIAREQGVQQAQARQEQLGSEQGRFGLLREVFGTPRYTSGQQSLDQVFLGRGAGRERLQEAGQNIAGQEQFLANELASQVQNLGGQIQDVAGLESEAQRQLLEQATGLETGFMGDLETRRQNINQQIAQASEEVDRVANLLRVGGSIDPNTPEGRLQQQMIESARQSDVYQNVLNQLGLEAGQQTYNVLDDVVGQELLTNYGQEARNVQDIVGQQDLDTYNALAQIAGIADDARAITGLGSMSDLSPEYNQQITEDIRNAQAAFLQDAMGREFTGTRSKKYGSDGLLSKERKARATATIDLGEYLEGALEDANRTRRANDLPPVTIQELTQGAGGVGLDAALGNTLAGPTGALASLVSGDALSNLGDSVSRATGINFGGGGESAAYKRAKELATQTALSNLENYLQESGYYDII